MAKNQLDQLQQLLMRRPASASTLIQELDVSQPTFSRLWAKFHGGIVLGASKARRYALRRPVAGVDAPIPVFRVSRDGTVESVGNIEPLQGGFYALMQLEGIGYRLFEGMPYFLWDLRPQGFLGRMEPSRNRDLDLPQDILRWTDEHVLKYISRRSEHAPGDLIVGNESYARYISDMAKVQESLIPDSDRAAAYPGMAERSMQGEPPGSSAGGEQPKFTAAIGRNGEHGLVEHVIVKFSPQVDTAGGRRWGDLLICEHLALDVLARNGIAAAKTSILEAVGRVFLEVVRFDRVGLKGRRPMATFAALDGELGMLDQSWTAVARELGRCGDLSEADVRTVEILDLFGALIGNTDKHHGNIAVAWAFNKRHQLLEAYDMLPMLYRPNTHGEVVHREWEPNLGARLELRHLPRCYELANQFWMDVLNDPRICGNFKRDVANRHLCTLHGLNL
ncbi:type II toxin-antitoxin system HipA family toxin YjjJ [Massilia glaciei]|uniref:type II toxin-antitoxin system HipA family toxin YjjJ n=1 Tax=Massilia glaciei TaxID=1524097 RepID=UPI0011B1DCA6|nr:type II toxin-antitoxin system HipA family toxin YjjJ [Massilia glaciei]